MRRARLQCALPLILACPAPLAAQWQVAADVGVSHLQRTGIPQSAAGTLGATITNIGERGWIRSSLLGVAAGAEQASTQALIAGSLIAASTAGAVFSMDGTASAYTEFGAANALSGEIMPRVQLGSQSRGGALGVGAGVTKRGELSAGLFRAAGDAWWIAGDDDQFTGGISAVHTGQTDAAEEAAVAPQRSYVDITGGWRRDHGGLALGANGGVRSGARSGAGGAWGSVDAAAWTSTRTAIVITGGRTLDDPVRGIPRTVFVSIALRVTAQPHASLARTRTVPGANVTIQRLDNVERRIDVHGVSGARVEIIGDFTDWMPVALSGAGDTWRIDRAITPGLHRIAVRVDGGAWIAPVNLPRATDDLGGVVGLITVP
jgi:hypothetical protein